MSPSRRWAFALALVALQGASTLAGASRAFAHDTAITVDGRYHSVTNGIANYDGFDRFRDLNGQPLPGWQDVLSSRG